MSSTMVGLGFETVPTTAGTAKSSDGRSALHKHAHDVKDAF